MASSRCNITPGYTLGAAVRRQTPALWRQVEPKSSRDGYTITGSSFVWCALREQLASLPRGAHWLFQREDGAQYRSGYGFG